VARPTIALAAQAFRDEIVLAGFSLLRSAPDPTTLERIDREVLAAQDFYGNKGWLDNPEGFFAPPPPPADVTVRTVDNLGRTYQRLFFGPGTFLSRVEAIVADKGDPPVADVIEFIAASGDRPLTMGARRAEANAEP